MIAYRCVVFDMGRQRIVECAYSVDGAYFVMGISPEQAAVIAAGRAKVASAHVTLTRQRDGKRMKVWVETKKEEERECN